MCDLRHTIYNMTQMLTFIQLAVSVLLVTAILLQSRGGGLSSVFGGQGTIYHARRGAEKFVFVATVILGALFLAIAYLIVALR